MNPEQSPRQCAACGDQDPSSFICPVSTSRRLCIDCLLKEHRDLFCPICLDVFVTVPPPETSIICLSCPSITHLACSPSSSFTCPPCSDPNFSFFPKSHPDQNGENGDAGGAETVVDQNSANALLAAANIAAVLTKNTAADKKKEAHKKIFAAKEAKKKAKEALENLQDIVRKQKASENSNPNPNPNKRKNSDR